jgi:phosphonate transport system substrate-binding protein
MVTAAGRRHAVAAMLALLLVPLLASATQAAPWVVGTYAYPQRDRAAAIQPLADYLGRRGGHPVRVVVLPSPTALVDAVRQGQVDVAVPNLHGYLQARPGTGDIRSLPVPDVPAAQADRYRAVLAARGDIDSVQALQRRSRRLRLALVGPDSASGGFVPVAGLQAMGLRTQSDFASVTYAGSHAAVLQALVDGRADVAALAADVYDGAAPQGLHVLWRSEPIPPGPLLCRATAAPCDAVAGWLLEAHAQDPSVMAALRAGWPEFGDAQRFTPAPSMPLGLPPID